MENLKFKEFINEVNFKIGIPEVKMLIGKLNRIKLLYNLSLAYNCESRSRSPEHIIAYLVQENLWDTIERLSKLDYLNLKKEFLKLKVRRIGFKWI